MNSFTPARLQRARKALVLLKQHKAKGLTAIQIIKSKPIVLQLTNRKKSKGNLTEASLNKKVEPIVIKQKIDYKEPVLDDNTKELEEYLEIETIQCQYCNRKFNAESLNKHSKVCDKRPDRRKKKQFDSSKARAIEGSKVGHHDDNKLIVKKKVQLWRIQSEQFRKAIGKKTNQEEPNIVEREIKPIDYVKCGTCGRSFNPEASKKHIPLCANRARMQKLGNTNRIANRDKLSNRRTKII